MVVPKTERKGESVNTSKLKGIMAEKGISQRKLAKQTGVGLNHINEVLNNKVSPRLSLVVKICEVLEIENHSLRSDIFFGPSEPKTEQKVIK